MPASTAGLSGTLTAGLQEKNQDSGVGCPGLKPAQGQECCWRVGAARMLWFVCTAVLSCHALAGQAVVTHMQQRHVASSPCDVGLHKEQQCCHCCQQLSLCRSRIGWDAATVQSSKAGLCTLDGLLCE